MANPLQSGNMSTPPPPQQNAIQNPQQATAPQMPAPTHAQTVAALRHFNALKTELTVLMKNPDLGKADMKSAIIDGVTRLVADRIVPPAAAVQQLSSVPERPKTWVQKLYQQNVQAENMVLAHHAAAFPGQGQQPAPDPDDHMDAINSLMQNHYQGAPNA